MKYVNRIRDLLSDSSGSVLIEFAMLAPLLFGLILGVFQIGLQMQGYNAMRSAMSDISRYTLIQYQKDNEVSANDIEASAYAIAIRPPYALDGRKLDIDVSEEASEISGTRKLEIIARYQPYNSLGFIGVSPFTMSFTKSIYVPV